MAKGLPSFLIIFIMISGCLGDSITSESNETELQEDFWDSYSVVAPVDTGINPYHDHFQKNQSLPQSFLDEFGVTMTCELTQTGTWEERVEADRETCWNLISFNDTVYFSGTWIIGAMGEEGGTSRRDETIRMVESLGGTVEAYYWCYGQDDFVSIMDFPDHTTVTGLALNIAASGTFSGNLTPLITVEEMDEMVKVKLGKYRLPGD